ncbi:MAG TPA: transglycosylase family protein [Acidimicrobiales bacterium]|nr:transglycosylase family protein [Acidimicrobiales bacterium]
MDDVAASRRRVWFALLLAATFVVALSVGLTTTPSTRPLHVEAAAAATVSWRHLAHHGETAASAAAAAPSTTSRPVHSNVDATTTSVARAALTRSTASVPPHLATVEATPTTRVVVTVPPTTAAPTTTIPASVAAFLACIRMRESHGDYRAVSANGEYRGAYQFTQSSWDLAAAHAGRKDLIGVPPNQASPADQDAMAYVLYEMLGSAPWGGACA